ncbi:MAG: MOSC domain-containing protein [Acidimicrobiales bacterium]
MKDITVRELWTYPVKSCQGVAAQAIDITTMGIVGDRGFAIWADGRLVEQKRTPLVASIGAAWDVANNTLTLRHADHNPYEHRVRDSGDIREATWVLDEFKTIDQGDKVAAWLSAILDREVRLVIPGEPWKINFPIPQMELLHEQPKQSFTAASPVGLANWASLQDFNTRVQTPVPMDRFRVNVVVDGLDAYAEDDIISLANDDVELLNVTAAERCVIISTDQTTGERPDNNLLQVLGEYRAKSKEDRFASGLKFGNYMTVGREGTLRVGDRLRVN